MSDDTEDRRDESFRKLNEDGTRLTQKDRAYAVLCKRGPMTGNQWTAATGLLRTSMCRVMYELVMDDLVTDTDEVYDAGSKRRVTLYRVKPGGRQIDLPWC
jgi:hypothetical protein